MAIPHHFMVLAFLATIAINASIGLHGLPITSAPLDDNPDHLTWDALLTINSYQPEAHEARKIPKSIFITPNFNGSAATCKPGYKLDPRDNKCYKEFIPVNQQQLLTMQALQAFNTQASQTQAQDSGSYTDSIEYDYEDEESRYEIPLSVSFAGDTPPAKEKPFLNDGTRRGVESTNISRRTTDSLPTAHALADTTTAAPHTSTKRTVDNIDLIMVAGDTQKTAENKLTPATRPIDDIPNRTTESTVVTTTTASAASTETTIIPSTESVLFNTIPTTTNDEAKQQQLTSDSDVVAAHNKIALAQLSEPGKKLTKTEEEEILKKVLKEESLFRDERPNAESTTPIDDNTSTTVDPMETAETTIVPETTTTSPHEKLTDETKIITDRLNDATITNNKPSTTTLEPIIVLPTKDRIQIVTPETTETSTVDSIIAATEQMYKETGLDPAARETETTKRQRQTVENNEMKADAMDTIDQHNRFVYAHLETNTTTTSTTTEEAKTTDQQPIPTSTTTTTRPPHHHPTRLSLRQQLNYFHQRSNEDNNRKRGNLPDTPNRSKSPLFANYRNAPPASPIQFNSAPSSSPGHQRIGGDRSSVTGEHRSSHQFQPQKHQQQPSPQPQLPQFSWLPSNWKFEASGQDGVRPTIKQRPALKFWHDMPLIRDPALTGIGSGVVGSSGGGGGGESTDRAARANSRSPTEQLFRQEESHAAAAARAASDSTSASASKTPTMDEVYKVVSTKNAHYQNR